MISDALNKKCCYFKFQIFELGDEGDVVGINLLLFLSGEIFDLIEDMFKSDGDCSFMDG